MELEVCNLNSVEVVTEEEQKIIVTWVKENYDKLLNKNGFNRYMNQMDTIKNIPECVWDIKKRIVEIEKLEGAKQEPKFRDSIGYMTDEGQLHKHTDPNLYGLIHTRFNVYLQIPEKGGLPVYDNKIINLKERTYVCCRSGLDLHYCQKVEGPKERIVLSYGFLLPYNRVANISYK